MSDATRLKEVLIEELVSIPTYLWGGFFAIHVALWRFLREIEPDVYAPVDAFKQSHVPQYPYSLRITGDSYQLTRHVGSDVQSSSGYEFYGPSADRLDALLWEEGPLVDAVEQLAYYLSDCTNREAFLRGTVSREDLPVLHNSLVEQLAERVVARCGAACQEDLELE